ncbi:MAG: (2Fe-2S) ferredoxin domain-containing protein [Gammaproteobacteria bacterium]|nr:(2Fe-2S) ferredoxin domain-containing protein [Gammaproteobacteria bacterium]
MAFYRYHVFMCTNQREPGEDCCANFDSRRMRDYLKARSKELGLHAEGGVRINIAGCLGRCELGPTLVIYPDAVWYTYVDEKDLDEILREHLQQGRVVERLRI